MQYHIRTKPQEFQRYGRPLTAISRERKLKTKHIHYLYAEHAGWQRPFLAAAHNASQRINIEKHYKKLNTSSRKNNEHKENGLLADAMS